MKPGRLSRIVAALAATLVAGACAELYDRHEPVALADFVVRPAVTSPAGNPITAEKVRLGRDLFNDVRLSADGTQSCASCHIEKLGFADGRAKARGRGGRELARSTPSLWNVGFASSLFSDGRASSLEAQALMPVMSGGEMARHPASAIDPIRADRNYRIRFARVFGGAPEVSEANVAKSIAAYERTLVSGIAPFDRWAAGEAGAISPAAARGFDVFAGRGNCVACHSGAIFTDNLFHDVGLPDVDLGRGAVANSSRLDHAFRTPSLREINRTAPYMHDGSLPTLDAVVDHYSDSLASRARTPSPARLSDAEKRDLVEFLKTLDTR